MQNEKLTKKLQDCVNEVFEADRKLTEHLIMELAADILQNMLMLPMADDGEINVYLNHSDRTLSLTKGRKPNS